MGFLTGETPPWCSELTAAYGGLVLSLIGGGACCFPDAICPLWGQWRWDYGVWVDLRDEVVAGVSTTHCFCLFSVIIVISIRLPEVRRLR